MVCPFGDSESLSTLSITCVSSVRLVKQGGKYVLFYSGNMMASYAIGIASATSVSGPYTKLGDPILHSAG
jgi:arabinan endo-1,5-alpha-L-arabinosidase